MAGSKGKYAEWITEYGLSKIKHWAQEGLTEKQICKNMGVGVTAFNEWKKRFPELKETLKQGKEVVDNQVVDSLLKAALGYEYEETITEWKANAQGQRVGNAVVRKIKKYMPPNVTAQIFWLKNRRPDLWRDARFHIDGGPGSRGGNLNTQDDGLAEAMSKAAKEVFADEPDVPANLDG